MARLTPERWLLRLFLDFCSLDLGFWCLNLEFWVWGLEPGVLGLWVWSFWRLRFWGAGLRVSSL